MWNFIKNCWFFIILQWPVLALLSLSAKTPEHVLMSDHFATWCVVQIGMLMILAIGYGIYRLIYHYFDIRIGLRRT